MGRGAVNGVRLDRFTDGGYAGAAQYAVGGACRGRRYSAGMKRGTREIRSPADISDRGAALNGGGHWIQQLGDEGR